MQGDVLRKSPELTDAIGQAHQYYANADHYSHFVVITQSCDLVRRRGQFNAPYITIAAARPFERTFNDFLNGTSRRVSGADFSFQPTSVQQKAKKLIERHINNTEPEYFFLPAAGHPSIEFDLVVFLRLTIALRKEHYDVLSAAKVAELADIFQAKLGWLKGNIYSRVATPDLADRGLDSDEIKGDFFRAYLPESDLVWLSGLQAERLRKLVSSKSKEEGRELLLDEVLELIENEVPNDISIISENIVERLVKNGLIDGGDADTVRKARC